MLSLRLRLMTCNEGECASLGIIRFVHTTYVFTTYNDITHHRLMSFDCVGISRARLSNPRAPCKNYEIYWVSFSLFVIIITATDL